MFDLEFFLVRAETRCVEVRWNTRTIGNAEAELLSRFKPFKQGTSNSSWRYMQLICSDEQIVWLSQNLHPSNIDVLRARTEGYLAKLAASEPAPAEREVVVTEAPSLVVELVKVEMEAPSLVVEVESPADLVNPSEVVELAQEQKPKRTRRNKKVA